jgi:hypothetical protein
MKPSPEQVLLAQCNLLADEVLGYNGAANPLLGMPKETVAEIEQAAKRLRDWADEIRGETHAFAE